MDNQTIKWGMVGCGDVTERKSAPALSTVAGSKLMALTSRTWARAKDYAHRHQVPLVFESLEEMLDQADLDAIYIATPPGSHLALAEQVAAVGLPVYIEKPMATTFAQCQRMNEVFAEKKLPLFVAYYRRALPNFLKVKELLDEQAIGKVQMVHIQLSQPAKTTVIAESKENWRVRPDISGGGYFYDLASHQFDLLEFLLGPIQNLQGFKTNRGSDYSAADAISASWHFADGTLGVGSWNFRAATEESEQIRIVGDHGEIQFPCFGAGIVHLHQAQNQQTFEFELPYHIQEPLIQSVVADLQGIGVCPSTGNTAARTNYWLEQVSAI